jgi:hypothetical protein
MGVTDGTPIRGIWLWFIPVCDQDQGFDHFGSNVQPVLEADAERPEPTEGIDP